MGMTRVPVSSSISLAEASRSDIVRETITTSTPSRANSLAIALPMPLLPPVTRACLPFSPKSMLRTSCPNSAWTYAVVRRCAGILHNSREGGKPLDGVDFIVGGNLEPPNWLARWFVPGTSGPPQCHYRSFPDQQDCYLVVPLSSGCSNRVGNGGHGLVAGGFRYDGHVIPAQAEVEGPPRRPKGSEITSARS